MLLRRSIATNSKWRQCQPKLLLISQVAPIAINSSLLYVILKFFVGPRKFHLHDLLLWLSDFRHAICIHESDLDIASGITLPSRLE